MIPAVIGSHCSKCAPSTVVVTLTSRIWSRSTSGVKNWLTDGGILGWMN